MAGVLGAGSGSFTTGFAGSGFGAAVTGVFADAWVLDVLPTTPLFGAEDIGAESFAGITGVFGAGVLASAVAPVQRDPK